MNEQMYCVKCRKKVTINNYKITTLINSKKAIKGKCPICNTDTYKIIKNN